MVVLDPTFEYASSRLKKLRNALWLKRLPQSCQRLRQVHRIASPFCKQRMRIAQRTVYVPAHIGRFRCCKLVLVKNFGRNPPANGQQADFFAVAAAITVAKVYKVCYIVVVRYIKALGAGNRLPGLCVLSTFSTVTIL